MPDLNYRHALLVLALAGAATVALVTNLPNSEDEDANILRIYHIDVEQADATLLVSPSGETLLIDSGKNGHGDQIKAVMDSAGVTQIDYFVCTHYHEDHFGGIDVLVDDFHVTVDSVYDRGGKMRPDIQAKINNATFSDYQRTVGTRADSLGPGMTIALDPDHMTVECISSGTAVEGESNPEAEDHDEENDNSIALLIEFGDFRYFIGGDIQRGTERKIADRDLVVDVDVYQANHHGSETSSTDSLLEDMKPTVVVISNGSHGTYHHPRKETLDRLEGLTPRPVVYQTNKYLKDDSRGGNVPDGFIADPETVDEDGTILITVSQSDSTYIVSYSNKAHVYRKKHWSSSGFSVVIVSLLPNPDGTDRDLERVTLQNKSSSAVSMAGWVLRDRDNKTWDLSSLGTLAPGESKTIQRNGMPMSLNNKGDEITLFDPTNQVRDRFSYSSSQEGQAIPTGH